MPALLALALAAAATAQPTAIEIRTCPERVVRSYPLDTLRAANSLSVAEIAIANTGTTPVQLDAIEIALLKGEAAADVRTLAKADVDAAARGTQAMAQGGAFDAAPFQFCDGRLMGGAKPASSSALQPGEAIILANQTFAWRGQRDAMRVTAGGSTLTLPIDGNPAPTVRWPLGKGAWMVANGPSLHTAHRWALPEQFALDIVKVDLEGRTHRGKGTRMAEFYAYGAPVVAVADGTVAAVFHAKANRAPMIRAPGETGDAYIKRIIEAQTAYMAEGVDAIIGEGMALQIGEGIFAVYAHMAPGSVRAKVGDRIVAGSQVGVLGNTGNTTEPHLHFQLCDTPKGLSCAGIPVTFSDIDLPLADEQRPIQSGDIVVKR